MCVDGESTRSPDGILCKSREDYRALRQNGVWGVLILGLKNTRKIGQFFIKP
jgi:glycosyltransferase